MKNILIASLVLGGAVFLFVRHYKMEWRKSQQKWRMDALEFRNNLKAMDIDQETINHLMGKMRLEEFENANKQLKCKTHTTI